MCFFAGTSSTMKRVISERRLVVILFATAFAVFFFAQQDTKKWEQGYRDAGIQATSPNIDQNSKITSITIAKEPSMED